MADPEERTYEGDESTKPPPPVPPTEPAEEL